MQLPKPMSKKIYDILGVGIGPFNLGLAALCQSIPELSCLFIDQNESFNWHPGLMIAGTRLQVPYYADLVTLVNPKSDFSYMMYLHHKKKMLRFAIAENCFITRKEYNDYCRWVADQLACLQFNQCCKNIYCEDGVYKVVTTTDEFYTKKLVIGTGTVPFIPECANNKRVFHSSDYLYVKDQLHAQDSVTIVGSGQSAAEIFYDLLNSYEGEISWFTRSASFFPMDYSKFALEKTSTDYIDHFYSLHPNIKRSILSKQDHLYKGINQSLIDAIYSSLYEKDPLNVHLHPNCELIAVSGNLELSFHHLELQQDFTHHTKNLILATGYHNEIPNFLQPIKGQIQWLENGLYHVNRNYSIDQHNEIFVQNADLHTHGFNSADLGMGPYRNAIILNTILGNEHFKVEKNISFQTFGLPQ
jgi:lysine N6-hydroxylase